MAGRSCRRSLQGGPLIGPPLVGGPPGEWRGVSYPYARDGALGLQALTRLPRSPSFCRERWRRVPEEFPNYRWGIISPGGVFTSSLWYIIKRKVSLHKDVLC